ncbi:hypothetical protein ASE30_00175 [Achromobacter sp. Root83]|nr:hypothetical protein ASE30_00175 [Achromobacter sp. Root83]
MAERDALAFRFSQRYKRMRHCRRDFLPAALIVGDVGLTLAKRFGKVYLGHAQALADSLNRVHDDEY